jgi:hypothetical protein
MHLSSPTYVLHVLPISLFFISSPEKYFVRSTEHEVWGPSIKSHAVSEIGQHQGKKEISLASWHQK